MTEPVSTGLTEIYSVIEPVLWLAVSAFVLGLGFQFFSKYLRQIAEPGYSSNAEAKKKVKPAPSEPKEDIYYSDKDHGYWVKLPDGSKTLVDMSELYPNDAAFQRKPSDAERFGTFIYDKTVGRMVRK